MAEDEGLARGLAVAVVLAAALVRFHALGEAPLSAAEASNAVVAWDLARGTGAPPAADPVWSAVSPLLASVQFLLFGLLGAASEGVARAPSALAGTALVLCPWLLRRRLGIPAALLLAGLLALDPASVEASRRGEGTALATLLGATVLVAARRGADDPGPGASGWWAGGAVALGLLLVTGGVAWTVAPLVLVVLGLGLGPGPRRLGGRAGGLARLAGAAALAGASGLLGAWGLIGGVSLSLTSWLAAGPRLPELHVATLLADPLALVLGITGLACLLRDRRLAALLAFAAGLGCTALSAPPLVSVVLIAAAAPAVQDALRRVPDADRLRRQPLPWIAALLAVLAVVGVARTVRLAAPGLGAPPASVAGIGLLARDVERLSSEHAGDPHELPVDVVCQPWPDPLLRFGLREMRRLRFHSGSPDPEGRGWALVIGPEPSSEAALPCTPPSAHAGAGYQAGSTRLLLWVPR